MLKAFQTFGWYMKGWVETHRGQYCPGYIYSKEIRTGGWPKRSKVKI